MHACPSTYHTISQESQGARFMCISPLMYVNLHTGANMHTGEAWMKIYHGTRAPTSISISIFLTGIVQKDKSHRTTPPQPKDFLYATRACLSAFSRQRCWPQPGTPPSLRPPPGTPLASATHEGPEGRHEMWWLSLTLLTLEPYQI